MNRLNLVEYLTPRGREVPIDSHSNDRWFQHVAIIVSDMDRAYLWLHQHNLEQVSSGPQLLPISNKNAGGISAGQSENYGTEQEHLNNVFGAHLRITSLRGTVGPGIELLEYLTPRDGRISPSDEHANDLVHSQTTLVSSDVSQVARQLEDSKAPFVSSGVIVDRESRLGFGKAFVVRDPDGHAVEIGQR